MDVLDTVAEHAALVLLRWRDAEPQVAERDDEGDRVGWNVAFTMMVPTACGAMGRVTALIPLPPITFIACTYSRTRTDTASPRTSRGVVSHDAEVPGDRAPQHPHQGRQQGGGGADLQRDLGRHHQAAQAVIAARIGAQGMAVRALAQGGLRQIHMDLIGVVEERPDEAEQL